MKLSDLLGIGRLGGPDGEGFFQVLIKPRYRDRFAETDDVFLIFNSDRVFYVTISEREVSDRKLRVKFAEDGVAEERKLHREAIIAIPAPEESAEEPEELLGYTVTFEGKEVGRVADYFHNNAQYVLVVEMAGGGELLIPLVDHFVAEIIPDPGVICLANAESLLNPE